MTHHIVDCRYAQTCSVWADPYQTWPDILHWLIISSWLAICNRKQSIRLNINDICMPFLAIKDILIDNDVSKPHVSTGAWSFHDHWVPCTGTRQEFSFCVAYRQTQQCSRYLIYKVSTRWA